MSFVERIVGCAVEGWVAMTRVTRISFLEGIVGCSVVRLYADDSGFAQFWDAACPAYLLFGSNNQSLP